MKKYHISKHNTFYCIGLNYQKADATVRGQFNLDEASKRALLKQAIVEGIEEIIIISTCNRTEIYGFAQHPYQLIKLLCDKTSGGIEAFDKVGYVYKNHAAISHLFSVGSGLNSQILGDFEIISQIKAAFKLSKEQGLINTFFERLINAVIQASKRIKNETKLSSGATSVAFASVQYMLKHVENISNKNILLFGTGKIGRNTCNNLIKHTHNKHITLINRTKNKAEEMALKFDLLVKDISQLQSEVAKADILIVATGASVPTIDTSHIKPGKPLLILDLSIPKNVSEKLKSFKHISLVHLDELTEMTDKTLVKRQAQIPLAEAIIAEVASEFVTWLETRKFAPTIKALKSKLEEIKLQEIDYQRRKNTNFNEEQAAVLSNRIIQKITKHFANHLKDDQSSTDESIEIISKVFQLEKAPNE